MTIRDLRIKRKLTQEELAIKLGVTRTAVAKWELGDSAPRAAMLPKLAKILRCSIDTLFK